MKHGLWIVALVILASSCGKKDEATSVNSPAPTPKKYFVSEVFNIGDSQLILNKDEFGFIDIPVSYLYFKNPDNTLAKITISGTNYPIVNEQVYRRLDIAWASMPTNAVNLKKDDGGALDAVNYTMINYLYFVNNKMCVDLEMINASGYLVVDRTICEN
jgi:hypothetical protein